MSARISLRGLRRMIWVVTLRRGCTVGCLTGRLICGLRLNSALNETVIVPEMRFNLIAIDLSAKAASVVFTICALFFAKRWLAKHSTEKAYEMEVRGSKPPVPQPRLSLQSDVSPSFDKDGET